MTFETNKSFRTLLDTVSKSCVEVLMEKEITLENTVFTVIYDSSEGAKE